MNVPLHHFQTSGANGKESPCQSGEKRDSGLSLAWENPLEEGMATQFSILSEESCGQGGWWTTLDTKSPTRLSNLVLSTTSRERRKKYEMSCLPSKSLQFSNHILVNKLVNTQNNTLYH